MDDRYSWDDLYKELDGFCQWLSEKPKWWHFKKRKLWKSRDPRKNWR